MAASEAVLSRQSAKVATHLDIRPRPPIPPSLGLWPAPAEAAARASSSPPTHQLGRSLRPAASGTGAAQHGSILVPDVYSAEHFLTG